MKRNLSFSILFVLGLCSTAQAAGGYRMAAISEVQSGASAAGSGQLVYVAQSGVAWVGSPSCPTDWAYFNAKDNPFFATSILAAQNSGKQIRIYVDDTLPKSGGFCQVSFVSTFP